MTSTPRPQGAELLEYVLQISRRMAEYRSLEPLLSFAIDEILTLVGAERGYIVLQGEDGSLDFRVGRDNEGRDIITGADQISRSILQSVVDSGKPLQVANAMTDPRFGEAMSVVNLRLRSVLCVPLITRQHTIGGIYVENRSIRNRFRQEDITPLQLFANQAAVAIENATLNDELKDANSHLKEIDRLKSEFVILVSHELKTPLTIVNASAHVIKKLVARLEGQDDDRILRTGERLEGAVKRMNRTLEDIILVFSIEAGQLKLRRSQISLVDLFQPLVDELKPVCNGRSLTLSVDGVADFPPIAGDPAYLRMAFDKILGNAIKYTPDGGAIEIRGIPHETGVEIVVKDEGIGVPLDEQKRVFEFFHILGSLDHHSSSEHGFQGGGLGLGLPIARALIAAHGGKLSLHSPGRNIETLPGTAVHIFLPFDRMSGD